MTATLLPKPGQQMSPSKAAELLAKLPVPEYYDDWLEACIAAHRVGVGDEDIERWCSTGPKYRPGEWTDYRAQGIDRYEGRPITPATFTYLCAMAGILSNYSGEANPTEDTQPYHFRIVTPDELLRLPDAEWIVDQLLPRDALAVLSGPPKAGKSTLLTAWATAPDWMGRNVMPLRWMHFTEETPKNVRDRYRSCGVPFTNNHAADRLLTCNHSWVDGWTFEAFLTEVLTTVQRCEADPLLTPIDVVVLDTILFWGQLRDANDATGVSNALRPVQQLKDALPGKTVLVVHQTRKGWNEDDAAENMLGSQAFRATFGVNLTISRQGTSLSLHAEGRELEDDIRIDYRRDKQHGVIVWSARSEINDVLDIMEAYADKAMTLMTIQGNLTERMPETRLRNALDNLTRTGKLVRSKSGRAFTWQLATPI